MALPMEMNIARVFSHVTYAHQAPLLKTCAFPIVKWTDLVGIAWRMTWFVFFHTNIVSNL